MAQDPYSVLGVGRQASADDIRKAYRKLAKQYHPDRNQGDKAAEDRFKSVSAAFEIVGDEEKRRRYDRGEIDADGNERMGGFGGGPFSGGGNPFGGRSGGFRGRDQEDISDIFADLFGQQGARRAPRAQKGRDVRYRLSVDFLDAARGATKRVTLGDGRTIDVNIPEGLRDGQTLRLRGQGEAGSHGGPAGDVFVEVSVKDHPFYKLEGLDITLDVPISLKEAVLGGKVEVPTPTGRVAIKVPPGTSSGVAFRLRGKGLRDAKSGRQGDLLARTRIMLPEAPDAELTAFAQTWDDTGASVRDDLLRRAS